MIGTRSPLVRRGSMLGGLLLLACGMILPAAAQDAPAAEFLQVGPGLYFNYDFAGSNSAVLITEEGVLIVDTRTHPVDAELLLAEIRKRTDAPIRWVINSQFHGDHYMGNSVFAREGATFIAHRDTLAIILERFDYEVATRPFEQRGLDPEEIELVLPDILFDHRLTLETRAGVLVFNPGECAGQLGGHNAVGVLDLVSLESELLEF